MQQVSQHETSCIHFIDGKCHIKQLKNETCLTNNTGSKLHHWLLMPRGRGHTHTHTSDARTKAISRN